MYHIPKIVTMVTALAIGLPVASAAEKNQTTSADKGKQNTEKNQNIGKNQTDPYQKEDESWITISGTVTNPKEDSFTLDYGEGVITVELDDYDVNPDKAVVKDGNRVTVSGRIDDNWFSRKSINAVSVYDQDRNQYSRSNSDSDNNNGYQVWWYSTYTYPVEVGRTTINGTVSSVDPDRREFTINSSKGKRLTVDTWNMSYNPLDDYGYQKIKVGDRVSISGRMTRDFADKRELDADVVTTLSEHRRSQARNQQGSQRDSETNNSDRTDAHRQQANSNRERSNRDSDSQQQRDREMNRDTSERQNSQISDRRQRERNEQANRQYRDGQRSDEYDRQQRNRNEEADRQYRDNQRSDEYDDRQQRNRNDETARQYRDGQRADEYNRQQRNGDDEAHRQYRDGQRSNEYDREQRNRYEDSTNSDR